MSGVPCMICGLKILQATEERNEGLCGQCAKGARPCVYCGRHVADPLPDGVYAHVECSIKHRQAQESLDWQAVSDIDWQSVGQILRTMLRRLFDKVGSPHTGTAPVNLRFCVHVEDFIAIFVQEMQPDGSAKRLSDSDWNKDLSHLDSSFTLLHEILSEEEAFEASESVTRSLTNILSDECRELEKHNFNYPRSLPVSWVAQSA